MYNCRNGENAGGLPYLQRGNAVGHHKKKTLLASSPIPRSVPAKPLLINSPRTPADFPRPSASSPPLSPFKRGLPSPPPRLLPPSPGTDRATPLHERFSSTSQDYVMDPGFDTQICATLQLTPEGVTQILNLCYNDLPADQKNCLLYLSIFPKGCSINRKRLIRRWISEGFIVEKDGKTVEEVAEDSFNELIGRNIVRAVEHSSNGKVKACQAHDMILEYIVSKSSEENFITVIGGHWLTATPSNKVRRLSLHYSNPEPTQYVHQEAPVRNWKTPIFGDTGC